LNEGFSAASASATIVRRRTFLSRGLLVFV